MQLGTDDPWLHLFSTGDIISCSLSFLLDSIGFLTDFSDIRKATSPTAIQAKQQQNTITTDKKLSVIS